MQPDRTLAGCSILIVEDEALIALDVSQAFEAAGASVAMAECLEVALKLVEAPGLTLAILDQRFEDGDASPLCKRLTELEIPFVIYSGTNQSIENCANGVHINKPANPEELVAIS